MDCRLRREVTTLAFAWSGSILWANYLSLSSFLLLHPFSPTAIQKKIEIERKRGGKGGIPLSLKKLLLRHEEGLPRQSTAARLGPSGVGGRRCEVGDGEKGMFQPYQLTFHSLFHILGRF